MATRRTHDAGPRGGGEGRAPGPAPGPRGPTRAPAARTTRSDGVRSPVRSRLSRARPSRTRFSRTGPRRNRRRGRMVAGMVAIAAVTLSGCATSGPTPASDRPGPAFAAADPTLGPVGPLAAPGGPFLVDRYGRAVLHPRGQPRLQGATLRGGGDRLGAERPRRAGGPAHGRARLRRGAARDHLEGARTGYRSRRTTPPSAARRAPGIGGPDQFDAATFDAYLSRLDATVALLAATASTSLIDMHQDVYNEVFGGEGAPDWAVCTDGVTPQARSGTSPTGA